MRRYEKLSTFGPSPGKTLSGRKNAPFCARQVCHGVTDVPNFGTSVTVGTEIRPGSRSYSHTLSAHRLPLRESAARANEECYGSRQDERSSIRHPRLLSMKGAPPPVTPCAAQVPVRLCLRQSPGTASVRWCGLRYALPTARLATPRLLPGAATPTGQQAGDFESPHGSQNRPPCSRRLW